MSSMETTIELPACAVPPEFVRWWNSIDPDTPPVLEPTDVIDYVEVEVEYEGGWFSPGKYSGPPEDCYPDEGEDPEILSITLIEPDYEGPRLLDLGTIPQDVFNKLVSACWDHQKDCERYDGPDYEPEDDYYVDDPSLDYLNF